MRASPTAPTKMLRANVFVRRPSIRLASARVTVRRKPVGKAASPNDRSSPGTVMTTRLQRAAIRSSDQQLVKPALTIFAPLAPFYAAAGELI
jgi:hypothetical protein